MPTAGWLGSSGREQIAAELGIDPADGYGLIAALGRDCPGAVVFLPQGAPPPRRPAREEIAWLEPRELEEVVATPPPRIFDPDRPQRMRFALPGERHKLALVRDAERGWAWLMRRWGRISVIWLEREIADVVGCRQIAVRGDGHPRREARGSGSGP